jgi:hypothetical protein
MFFAQSVATTNRDSHSSTQKREKKKESTNQNITINVFLHDLQQKKIQSKKKAHNYPHFRQ